MRNNFCCEYSDYHRDDLSSSFTYRTRWLIIVFFSRLRCRRRRRCHRHWSWVCFLILSVDDNTHFFLSLYSLNLSQQSKSGLNWRLMSCSPLEITNKHLPIVTIQFKFTFIDHFCKNWIIFCTIGHWGWRVAHKMYIVRCAINSASINASIAMK